MNVISGPTYYRLIKQWCEPQGSGGRAPGPAQIEAGSNQYVEAGAVPASFARRSSIRTTTRSAKPQLRVDSKTIEEMEVFWETVRNETIQRQSEPTIQKRVSVQSILAPVYQFSCLSLTRSDNSKKKCLSSVCPSPLLDPASATG